MKKILSYMAFASLLLLGGCNSLDLSPVDYSAAGNYWKNEAQIQTYLNGLMGNVRNDYRAPFILGEVRGAALKEGTSLENVSLNYSVMVTNRLTKDNTGITDWNGFYPRILQINHYIEQVRDHCDFLTDAQRSLYLAPAYGLRAYYYFYLYRTFGGVPLETSVKLMEGRIDLSGLYMARATAEETINFIKEDIARSEEAYGSDRTLDRYTWSYYATQVLKAQVYLWAAKVTTADETGPHTATGSSDLTTARTALQNITGSEAFGLMDNYADIFSYAHKANREEILAIYFNNTETTNLAQNFVFQAALTVGLLYDEAGNLLGDPLDLCNSGMHRNEYRESLVRSFDTEDTRRAATFFEAYDSADPETRKFGSCVIKYMGHTESGSRYYDSDVIVYRYADVLLMLAEIENSLGNYGAAAGYINQIRERAYGEGYPEFPESDFAATELAILKERDKEFVAEGTRWFDLIRLHDADGKPLAYSAEAAYAATYGGDPEPVLSENESHKLLWPVNAAVLAGDPLLKQTVGY